MQEKDEFKRILDNLKVDEQLLSRYKCHQRINKEKAWHKFCRRAHVPFYKRIGTKRMLQYAATLLIPLSLLTAGLLHWVYRPTTQATLETIASAPQYGATLTLSNGETILLNDADTTSVQHVPHATISREAIVYKQDNSKNEQLLNTLSTDNKREFRIELSDGTRVHLNKSSKLIYPVNFGPNNRIVILVGEAFFEIAKDPQRPFFVETGSIKVKQFGTSFNLSAYAGHDAAVVLVEGAVEVSTPTQKHMMQPGELASYNPTAKTLDVQQVNPDLYTAWHTGKLSFHDLPLSELAHVLSQWYNVQFTYEEESLKDLRFNGRITRQDNLQNILERLEYTQDMTFRIDGESIQISRRQTNTN